MYGKFDTERLAVKPWKEDGYPPSAPPSAADTTTTSSSLTQEIAEILEEDVTAFLPESLVFQRGKSDAATWARTFSNGNDVSSVRFRGDGGGDNKHNNKLAGLLMMRTESVGNIHIGYIFGKAYWGQGLATELNRGLVDHLIQRGYDGTLHAGVVVGNPASAAVLKKVGFQPVDKSGDEKSDGDVDMFIRRFKE